MSKFEYENIDYKPLILEFLELAPVAGRKVHGELSESDLKNLYHLQVATKDTEDIQFEIVQATTSNAIDLSATPVDHVTNWIATNCVLTKFQAEEFFQSVSTYCQAYHNFWHPLRHRLKVFSERVEIAAGWKVVGCGLYRVRLKDG